MNLNSNIDIRSAPAQLIKFNDKEEMFVAIRIDKHQSCLEAIGFFTTNEKSLKDDFTKVVQEMITNSPEKILEISFPWHRVESVANLGYRHKGRVK